MWKQSIFRSNNIFLYAQPLSEFSEFLNAHVIKAYSTNIITTEQIFSLVLQDTNCHLSESGLVIIRITYSLNK